MTLPISLLIESSQRWSPKVRLLHGRDLPLISVLTTDSPALKTLGLYGARGLHGA